MAKMYTTEDVLKYHGSPRPGKLENVLTKPCRSQLDLTLAYSPGVADACNAIVADPAAASKYTGRSNLVAVVSNGTAVLGLGDIGPLAGKPVMEGKGVLFKNFGDVDAYDINLDVKDPLALCQIVKAMEPTFGGINLEDIKAPECFLIEETLKKAMNIPVFHDDQHGTAVISGAALLNACEITGRKIEDIKVVVMGAGSAGIACTKLYCYLGVKHENVFMFDSKGLIYKGRKGLNKYKEEFAQDKNYGDLAACLKGADLFLGLSKGNLVSKEMLKSMNKQPIVFAMANPTPEISYEDAKEAVPDCIMGTGRSDYPNQINNVSCFPYLFRGALDVEATDINEEMKLAATKSLAALAKEPFLPEMAEAYKIADPSSVKFGTEYVLPKALDPRILTTMAPAVAKAAMDSGVAKKPITDFEASAKSLEERRTASRARMNAFIDSYGK